MAYTDIDKPSDYFETKLYTGNGSTQSITGLDFQPDFTWIKSRTTGGSGNNNHCINDVVRTKGTYGYPMIHPNLTAVEYDPDSGNEVVTDFQSDGFDLGGNENSNYNTATYASWNWLANGAGSANTDGSITSTVSANTTSGFSIVSYTGNATDNATVGHGLSQKPDMVIIKARENTSSWVTWHKDLTGSDYLLFLDATDAQSQYTTILKNQSSSVLTLGTNSATNASGQGFISYNFHSVKGYSKFGSYTGNGSTDGTFVYTGFKPAFVLGKRTDSAGGWWILDSKRPGFNLTDEYLLADSNQAEADDGSFATDFLSNGWKARATNGNFNASGGSYIYMAFAENPFVTSTGVPACAR